jgi:prophage DNA circulation protein
MRRLARSLPLLLVLTACSTGQEADGGSSLEDRRAAYVDQVEEACTEANEELAALERPTSVDGFVAYTDAVVDLLSRTVSQVATAEPPEEDLDEVTEKVLDPLADDVGRAEEYAEQVRAADEAGDSAALLGLVSQVPETSADVPFMRGYGMIECAKAAELAG